MTSSQTPFIVNAAREENESKKINRSFTVQLLFFCLSFIAGIVIMLFFKNFVSKITGVSTNLVLFILLFYIAILLKRFFENLFSGLNKKKTGASYSLVVGVLNILVFLFFVNAGSIDLDKVFASYLISTLAGSVLFIFFIDMKKLFPLVFDKTLFRDTLNWSLWNVLGLISIYLINWGDSIILKFYTSLEDVGIYNIAYQIFKGFIGVSLIVNNFFLPVISRDINNNEKIKRYLNHTRMRLWALGITLIIIATYIIPKLIQIFYNHKYDSSIPVLQILMIGLIAHFLFIFYIPIINSLRRKKAPQVINTIVVIINLILDLILIKRLGVIGPAIATSIAYWVGFFCYLWYFRSYLKPKLGFVK